MKWFVGALRAVAHRGGIQSAAAGVRDVTRYLGIMVASRACSPSSGVGKLRASAAVRPAHGPGGRNDSCERRRSKTRAGCRCRGCCWRTSCPPRARSTMPPNLGSRASGADRHVWRRRQEAAEVHARVHRRGYHQIGPLVLETGDLFGLHRRFRVAGRAEVRPRLPAHRAAGRLRHRLAPAHRRRAHDAPPLRGPDAHRRRPRRTSRATRSTASTGAPPPAPASCTARSTSPRRSPASPSCSTSTRTATTRAASRSAASWPSPPPSRWPTPST